MNDNDNIKFYKIKDEIRILGIDDSPFDLYNDKTALVIGTIFRGGNWLDGVLRTEVTVDGTDATEKILQMVKKTKHKDLRIIMIDGITLGGFNVVNIKKLFEKTGLGVIVVVRHKPNFRQIKQVLNNLKDGEKRWDYMQIAGEPKKVETKPGKFIYIQNYGINDSDAKKIVKLSSTRSLIPEPIRVAHLIGSGIILGESRGKA